MDMMNSEAWTGTRNDDVNSALSGGSVKMAGYDGNDTLTYEGGESNLHTEKSMLSGNRGNDILVGQNTHRGQIHMMGGDGDDHLEMDVTRAGGEQSLFESDGLEPSAIGRHGHHAYGGKGHDVFEFVSVDAAENRVTGRIDDFDESRDTIRIDGQDIDLKDPPEGVRIVGYQGQQWILIEDKILYSLEGARVADGGGEERHFVHWPEDWADGVPASADEAWIDQNNQVDEYLYDEASVNVVRDVGEKKIVGTSRSDFVTADKTGGSREDIYGRDGDDVVDAMTGHDKVFGGNGNDSLSGGTDNDLLAGGNGHDSIWGGSEDDSLRGEAGNDMLDGGTGDDRISGGAGKDVFVMRSGGDKQEDLVTDFVRGQDILLFDCDEVTFQTSGSDLVAILDDGSRVTINGLGDAGLGAGDFLQVKGLQFSSATPPGILRLDEVSENLAEKTAFQFAGEGGTTKVDAFAGDGDMVLQIASEEDGPTMTDVDLTNLVANHGELDAFLISGANDPEAMPVMTRLDPSDVYEDGWIAADLDVGEILHIVARAVTPSEEFASTWASLNDDVDVDELATDHENAEGMPTDGQTVHAPLSSVESVTPDTNGDDESEPDKAESDRDESEEGDGGLGDVAFALALLPLLALLGLG